MENRINVSLTQDDLGQILAGISALRSLMPFLIKLSDADRKALQMMDDGRKPFTEKAYDLASRNDVINPGRELSDAGLSDLTLFQSLATIENELLQLVEGVHDTRQLAGAETFEIARFIYMKAKMAERMRVPGMTTIVEELGKLYRQTPAAQPDTPPVP